MRVNEGTVSWRDIPDSVLVRIVERGGAYPGALAEFDRRFGSAPVYFCGPWWLRVVLRIWPFSHLWKHGMGL